MLSNQEYIGDTINFKTYTKSNKLKKRLKNSPENILVFRDTHEAIIDRKTFEIVQRHFAGRKRPDKQGGMDKYAGYLFCGECGKRLYLHRSKSLTNLKITLCVVDIRAEQPIAPRIISVKTCLMKSYCGIFVR